MKMEKRRDYTDPSNWEYDGGTGRIGEITDPIRKKFFDDLYTQSLLFTHNAIIFATLKHDGQKRKGTDIPYITHPMEVMQILTANGCSEAVIAAGILHDVLEDTITTEAEIEEQFGDDVLHIVKHESEDKSKSWKERKQATLDDLGTADLETKLVCCADKLSSLRSMLADKAEIGGELWKRFNAPKNDLRWYYEAIADKLKGLSEYAMYDELVDLIPLVFEECAT
jgi:(p)ppGpp synthase/HD superfamily hydrolase